MTGSVPTFEVMVVTGDGLRSSRPLTAAVELGRESMWSVEDPSVSRRHLRLEPTPVGVVVEDLGSANGTVVNGRRITSATVVGPGDTVTFGAATLRVAAAPSPTGAAAAPPAAAPPEGTAAGGSGPVIAAARPGIDELESLVTEAAIIRYRPGTIGEALAPEVAKAVVTARRRLAGLGSEPWGIVPHICLVDPFPDPHQPDQVVGSGAVVNADRHEIWVAVTADAAPETPERYLARYFGASLPAAADLGLLLDGFALHLAGLEPDDELRGLDLPPLSVADPDLATMMATSFVAYLIRREHKDGAAAFVRFVSSTRPGGREVAAREVYGEGLARLEQHWRADMARGPVKAKPRAFIGMALREMRPHLLKQGEIAIYMLMGLGFTTVFPFVFRELVDTAIPSGEWGQVTTLLGLLAAALAVSLLAGLRRSYLAAYVSTSVITRLRTRMFERLQQLSPGWFHRREQGDVLSRFLSDVGQVESGFSAVLRDGAFQLLSLVVSMVVLIALHPVLAIIVISGVPIIAAIYLKMSDGALKRSMAVQEQSGALLNVLSENYSAQPVVKAFGLEAREIARFGRASQRLFDSNLRLSLFGGVFGLSVNGVVTALRLVVLAVGVWMIFEGRLTIGGLVAFMGVMGEVLGPVGSLTGVGQQLQASTGALARVNEILEAELDVPDPADAPAMAPLSAEIRFDDVTFSYSPGAPPVISNLSCVIPAGSKVAFVGPSGAGKSSVLNLLIRFYDPSSGSVLIDGRDIRTVPMASLRRQMGIVFQDNFLFDITVRENLRLARPDATDDEIEAAAQAAAIHDTIVALPDGYDTLVGERGGRLSGGQRQRLAIARAILSNPSILVLDEATSALDPRTERQISATLDELGEGRTTVAVTHRLASVVDYDQVFVLVDGRLVEQGTHDELLARAGVYAHLWSEQVGPADREADESATAPVRGEGLVLRATIGPGGLASTARAAASAPAPAAVPDVEDIRRTLGPMPRAN